MSRQALRVATVVTSACALLLLAAAARFERRASGGERVRLLVATRPLERGAVLGEDMLAVREVPADYVQGRAVRHAEQGRAVGSRLRIALRENETLLWTDLALPTDERSDFSCLITPGKRAVTVPVLAEIPPAGTPIGPGDYVDVRATVLGPRGKSGPVHSVMLLKRLLVLATEPEPSSSALSSAPVATPLRAPAVVPLRLTLSAHLQEVQYLALAAHDGELTVSFREPDDDWTGDEPPSILSSCGPAESLRPPARQQGRTGPVRLNR